MTAEVDAQAMWNVLDPVEKREIILGNFSAMEWCEEENLNVLAVFFDNAVQWMRIKARAKQVGVNCYDLERAVKQIRARHATWKAALGAQSPGIKPQPFADPTLGVVDWQGLLMTNSRGEPSQNAFNIGSVLEHHQAWKGVFWWDAVRMVPMVIDQPLSDKIVTEIARWLGANMRIGCNNLRLLERCIVAQCQEHPRDLLKEWLRDLPDPDPIPNLDTWIPAVTGAVPTDYHKWVGKMLVVSMVARAMNPGCIQRYVCILEGKEWTSKSALVRALAPDYCTAMSASLEGKESHMHIQGKWVCEWPELDALSRTGESRLKSFVTMCTDDFVPKYSNTLVSYPRRTIFVGTTNEEQYLKGQTGNTRFLPVATTKIDVDLFESMRDQLFGEALAFYQAHLDDWWQPPATVTLEWEDAREQRRLDSPFEEILGDWLSRQTGAEFTWKDVATGALGITEMERLKDKGLQMQVAAALRQHGYRRQQKKDHGKKTWVWCKL
jgi:putative DNA primase/helicase